MEHVLRSRFGDEPIATLGMGDSLTDAPFLGLCDYELTPRSSQLARCRRLNAEAL